MSVGANERNSWVCGLFRKSWNSYSYPTSGHNWDAVLVGKEIGALQSKILERVVQTKDWEGVEISLMEAEEDRKETLVGTLEEANKERRPRATMVAEEANEEGQRDGSHILPVTAHRKSPGPNLRLTTQDSKYKEIETRNPAA